MTTRRSQGERSSEFSRQRTDEQTEGKADFSQKEKTQFDGNGKSDKDAIADYKNNGEIGVSFDADRAGEKNEVLRYRMERGNYKGENLDKENTNDLGYARAMAFTEAMSEQDNRQLEMGRQLVNAPDFKEKHPDDWAQRAKKMDDYEQAVNFSKEVVAHGLMSEDEEMVRIGRLAMTEYGKDAYLKLNDSGDDWRQRSIHEAPKAALDPKEKYEDYDGALVDKIKEQERYQNDMASYHALQMTADMDPAAKQQMEGKIKDISTEYHAEMLANHSNDPVVKEAKEYLESQATEFKKKNEMDENHWRIMLAGLLEWMLKNIFLEKIKKPRRAPQSDGAKKPEREGQDEAEEGSAGTGGTAGLSYAGAATDYDADGAPDITTQEAGESFASSQDYGRAIMSLGYNANHEYSFDAHGAMQEHEERVDDLMRTEASITDIREELKESIKERTDHTAEQEQPDEYFNWFDQQAARAAIHEMGQADLMLSQWQEQGLAADEVDEEQFDQFREKYVNGMFLDDMAKNQWTSKAVMETWENEGFKKSLLEHEEREAEAVSV